MLEIPLVHLLCRHITDIPPSNGVWSPPASTASFKSPSTVDQVLVSEWSVPHLALSSSFELFSLNCLKSSYMPLKVCNTECVQCVTVESMENLYVR